MFDGHCMPVVSCRYNKARDLLATGDLQGDLMIWDMRQPKIPANSFKEAHKGRISGMSWCPWQPDLLATGNARHQPTLKFWNLLTGLKSRERRVSHEVTSVQWLESEQELISSHMGTPEAIVFWNYPSLERCGTLTNDDDETNSTGLVSVKKSYQMIATSEESDSIYVWDLEQTRESMTSHRGQPSTVLSRRRSLIQLGLMR
ncbi:anaphase-promoting complex subunit cdc20-like [Lytechinus variegatus]|uniref:anaphase-promoting complex subunit cdc20-like n=1 Tax=Lytechinus variegatus TaxID=7654 RepID=UPI001BB225E8|nr:anaphase-promoting complex subunit cdc20-like [Lytechinus variegatus]